MTTHQSRLWQRSQQIFMHVFPVKAGERQIKQGGWTENEREKGTRSHLPFLFGTLLEDALLSHASPLNPFLSEKAQEAHWGDFPSITFTSDKCLHSHFLKWGYLGFELLVGKNKQFQDFIFGLTCNKSASTYNIANFNCTFIDHFICRHLFSVAWWPITSPSPTILHCYDPLERNEWLENAIGTSSLMDCWPG